MFSEWLSRVLAAVLLAVGLLLWAQGTLLVPDYGPLYGEALDLAAFNGRVPYELALWAGVLGLAVAYARQVSRIAALLSLVFISLQVAAIVVSLAGGMQARGRAQSEWSGPPPPSCTRSHARKTSSTSSLTRTCRSCSARPWPRTAPSSTARSPGSSTLPITSAPFRPPGPACRRCSQARRIGTRSLSTRFRGRTLERRSIATALAEHGFEVRSITFHRREHPSTEAGRRPAASYTIPTPYGSYEDYVRFTALQLFDFAAFRHVPQALKASVYNDDAWLWQRGLSAKTLDSQRSRMVRPSNHAAFLTEMADRLTVGVDGPVYQFIHVAVPHPPVVLDAECSFMPPAATTRRLYAGSRVAR